ncbi:MAG: hypothetical protein IRZ00_19410 [Gemmatimonadetes bacterium]|nr:hypothetical protein [Gemmatimonadota bacterium]
MGRSGTERLARPRLTALLTALVTALLTAGCRADRGATREAVASADGTAAGAAGGRGAAATPAGSRDAAGAPSGTRGTVAPAAGAGDTAAAPAPLVAGTPAPAGESDGDTAAREAGATAADAVAVIRDYYGAIARRDYAAAYALWGDGGRASGQSLDAFRRGYAGTASVEVVPGTPGRIEGAAGSRYVEVPVEVHARTADGARQCFRGAYTLRRVVVDGAPPADRRWHIYTAKLSPVDASACAAAAPAAGAPAEVEALVRRFGEALSRVSLLAPVDTIRRALRAAYSKLVTRKLLDAWLADPGSAPGRAASSPWPERIEIRAARRVSANEYRVEGDVVYVTSVELVQGGAVARKPVTLRVVRADGAWRIAAYSAGG